MADPEPPQPVPFPIRIVNDPRPPPSDDEPIIMDGPPGKRSDYFYEAWSKFLAIEPRRAKTIGRMPRKTEEEQQAVGRSPGDGLQVRENASSSWEHAVAECKAKVAAIVEESRRLNQKYRDAIFDLERNAYCLQNLNGRYPKAVDRIDAPPWVKRVEDIFDDPQFFVDGASAQDVHQGSSGDCWFLAALMAVSAKKDLIEDLCVARDEAVGVYGFVFFRDGEWIHEVIDDKLFLRVGDDDNINVVRDWDKDTREGMFLRHDEEKLLNQLQRGGEALYFSHCKSSETWLPLIEKAYAKAHGDYYAIEGGFASEAIEDLTGGVGVVINPEEIMDKNRFWREQLSQVNQKYLFGGGSKNPATKGMVSGHAYAVLRVWEEGDLKLLKLRNPWGDTEWEGDWSDGSKLWTPEMMMKLEHTFGDDGVFWISYKDFLKHFPSINRVRLFDSDWQVAQQWTSVNVPWTVDYLDTKFQFTIQKKCSVVIVLSQPDDRYFYGLRGRFLYSLHFRVYKEDGDGRWIVRSMHNSGNENVFTRSVSAEIEDLEPGTYNVVFKVTAVRSQVATTAEEAIMKYAVERKEKLLHVGRRFDYAQSKGNLKAMEQTNKNSKRQKRKDSRKSVWKKERRLNQQEKERAKKRKKRIDVAMFEKRRAFEAHKREWQRLKEEQSRESKENEEKNEQAEGGDEEGSDSKAGLTPQTDDSAPDAEADAQPSDSKDDVDGEDAWEDTTKDDAEGSKEDDREDKTGGDANEEGGEDAEEDGGEAETGGDANEEGGEEDGGGDQAGNDDSPLDDEEYDPLLEEPEEMDNIDFDWDSDIDGPIDSDDDEDPDGEWSASGANNEIFADDPWNAICVLGLRVYSLNADAKISVIKGDESAIL